jgi:hypothetical protein
VISTKYKSHAILFFVGFCIGVHELLIGIYGAVDRFAQLIIHKIACGIHVNGFTVVVNCAHKNHSCFVGAVLLRWEAISRDSAYAAYVRDSRMTNTCCAGKRRLKRGAERLHAHAESNDRALSLRLTARLTLTAGDWLRNCTALDSRSDPSVPLDLHQHTQAAKPVNQVTLLPIAMRDSPGIHSPGRVLDSQVCKPVTGQCA